MCDQAYFHDPVPSVRLLTIKVFFAAAWKDAGLPQ